MGKVDYIIISNPEIVRITADNPVEALKEYLIKCPASKSVIMFPRKAGYINGKTIKP